MRLGLPSAHGRGVDQLPKSELNHLDEMLIIAVELRELRRTLNLSARLLVEEIMYSNNALAENLTKVFKEALRDN